MNSFTENNNNFKFNINSTTTTRFPAVYAKPNLVQTIVLQDSIELVYIEEPLNNTWPQTLTRRVFKEVFSCLDGKWNKSERIYGYISPAKDETYEFEE